MTRICCHSYCSVTFMFRFDDTLFDLPARETSVTPVGYLVDMHLYVKLMKPVSL